MKSLRKIPKKRKKKLGLSSKKFGVELMEEWEEECE
jgi:hypothetical protein